MAFKLFEKIFSDLRLLIAFSSIITNNVLLFIIIIKQIQICINYCTIQFLQNNLFILIFRTILLS